MRFNGSGLTVIESYFSASAEGITLDCIGDCIGVTALLAVKSPCVTANSSPSLAYFVSTVRSPLSLLLL
jgi:hypothetical protein